MKTLVVVAIVVAGALARGAGQEPEGQPLNEWEQLAEKPANIGAVTTWYVDDDDCPKPGSGTEDDPFCLIQVCIDAVTGGDGCVVAPGTYFENINFLGKAITLRSSEGPEATTIDAGGSGSVVTCNSGEGPDTVLDGFTITGGQGSGMRNFNSSPTVMNCTFSGNADDLAGGMNNFGSSPTLTDCMFSGNNGRGMFNEHSSPTLTRCTFSSNIGGGMSNIFSSSPTLIDCTFNGNSATRGGGMFNCCSSTMINCIFSGNSATMRGGAIFNSSSSPTVINCTFVGNLAGEDGGAIYNGGIYSQGGGPTLTNCVLWDNGPNEIVDSGGSSTTVRYSDVQSGWPGEGNIDLDPLFVDSIGEDLHLSTNSPCIDAGDNTAVPEGIVTDLDGNPRFVDDPSMDDTGVGDPPIVDMGAYEFRDPCVDDDGDGRVTICHVPPGNPDNAHTITVSANALRAHLAHGDACGPCPDSSHTGRRSD